MSEPRPPDHEVEPLVLDGEGARQLVAAVAARTLGRAPSPRDRLRELPTQGRIALAVGAAIGASALIVGVQGLRPDLDAEGWNRVLSLLVILPLIALALPALALRPLHRSPLGVLPWWAAALALGLPAAASLVPVWPGIDTPDSGALWIHLRCFAFSTLTGLLVVAVLRLFDRSVSARPWRLLVSAGAGGLLGFTAQVLVCPVVELPHLMGAHGMAGFSAGLVAGALLLRGRR